MHIFVAILFCEPSTTAVGVRLYIDSPLASDCKIFTFQTIRRCDSMCSNVLYQRLIDEDVSGSFYDYSAFCIMNYNSPFDHLNI